MKKSVEWTRPDEIEYLTAWAAKVPRNGHIVEIGTWKGHTTTALLKGAHKTVMIHTFDDYKYDIGRESVVNAKKQFLENILAKTKNILLYEKLSPPENWTIPVDLVFIDAKRSLYKNIDFWYKKLTPNGILTGHDYNKENPSVVKTVDEWLNNNNKEMKIFKFIWRIV